MSNNCCTSSLVEGGTLLEPRIINGELQSPSVKGSITLDEPALLALSAQLCAVLSDCIEREIHGGSFNDVTLRDAELHSAKLITAALEGAVTLNDAAKKSIADAVGPELTTHVLKIVSENKIADAKLLVRHYRAVLRWINQFRRLSRTRSGLYYRNILLMLSLIMVLMAYNYVMWTLRMRDLVGHWNW
ncbi:hypothetical protein H6S30_26355 (plasmid) [Escherichia coli]|nr:hypothetical protein H6S30_26355 [Escherichia coli]